jgi:hypothetical protein
MIPLVEWRAGPRPIGAREFTMYSHNPRKPMLLATVDVCLAYADL